MIGLLKKNFTAPPKADFAKLIADGAVILDVRTEGEYAGGHIKNSLNIPLNELPDHLKKLKKKAIITCCASGMRSSSAKNILQSNGFTVYNGGSWMNLKKYVQ